MSNPAPADPPDRHRLVSVDISAVDISAVDKEARLRAREERVKARDARLNAKAERLEGTPARPAKPGRSAPADLPAMVQRRLSAFADFRIVDVLAPTASLSRAAPAGGWPDLVGCLVILFTARSGSTFLSRECEARFDLGKVGETLNPKQLRARGIAARLRPREGRWFGCKAGVQGVVSGEMAGFFQAYLDRCVFLRLVRRDIVAQAVSLDRAERTGGWHERADGPGELAYDFGRIARAVEVIIERVGALRRWAELTGRPTRQVVYEEVVGDNLPRAIAICDALGAPRRKGFQTQDHRAVERMGDELNGQWQERFQSEMGDRLRDQIATYGASL